VGLGLVPEGSRAPTRTTTFGVGELVVAALDAGARRVMIGLGGTATTDGGAGLAQALGVLLHGAPVPVRGEQLAWVVGVDSSQRDPRLSEVPLVALADVDNPLTGPEGAARVFGPQKGAAEAEVQALDQALSCFAAVVGDPGVCPGDGAAGGLGYALRVFAGAERRRGIDFVLDAVGFDARQDGVDLVLTGEGRLDAQSARGKVVSGVVERCRARGAPVMALVGALGPGAESLVARLTRAVSLTSHAVSEAVAMERAAPLLEELTTREVRAWAQVRSRRGL
jgi:glycerate kinase